ncbi:SpoIIE family protein phosphatase [Spirochaetota bacterium]
MKIKYKLILLLISIILIASLPISFFILKIQESEKIDLLTNQGIINSKILAMSTLNLLIMNGGSITATRIDSKEMLSILKPLKETGLLYADTTLISPNEKYNGIIISSYTNKIIESNPDTLKLILSHKYDSNFKNDMVREIKVPEIDDTYYEIISRGAILQRKTYCMGRLIFSKSILLSPINKLRNIIYISIFSAILIAIIIGLVFSRFISKPIDRLIIGAEEIGSGDLNYRIPVSSKDELGKLARTFNHLAEVIKLEIGALQDNNRELRRIDNLKDEFLATISHEFRTPLYGMIGLTESLLEGVSGSLNVETILNLSLIKKSGKQLTGLINDILDFSKLKHYDIKLNMSTVDMYSITQYIMSIISPLLKNKNIEIKNKINPESVFILGDEIRLQQIMLNLLSNAVKFTETGSIEISSQKDHVNDKIIINVKDTGMGIHPEKIKSVFNLFEQVDGSATRKFGGTGLGLTIAKKLVELHGGEIWVESSPGRGSCFSFSLNESKEKQLVLNIKNTLEINTDYLDKIDRDTSTIFEVANTPKNFNGKRIVVVDDEPINIKVILNHLTLEGYEVITATTGSEVLQIFEENALPNLLILDVMLPRMSGYELCSTLRKTYSQYELPILMLTAKNKPADIAAGIDAGANDYVTKPVSKMELIARVNNLISLKDSVKIHDELSSLKRDLHIAHEIQDSIILKDIPQGKNFAISVQYEPMFELGGDYYDIQVIDDKKVGILIADVSGHGIPAAIICAMLRVTFTFFLEDADKPDVLMSKINATMFNHTSGQFITACYAYIDLEEKKLYQANAGHWPSLLYKKKNNEIIFNENNGMPFGWMAEENFPTNEFDLEEGDRFVMYTDGILETKDEKGEMFGNKNFKNLILNSHDLSCEKFTEKSIDTVKEWSGINNKKGLEDDITMVVVDFNF